MNKPEKKVLTLCIPHQGKKVLLGMKKRGFGAGRWNGFGGKLAVGETIEDATRREAREEAGIEITAMEKVGLIDFEFKGNPEILEVHIFKVHDFSGKPKEGEEMRPEWFFVDEIPFNEMWSDDPYWFPLFLQGKKFKGYFLFDKSDKVLKHELGEWSGE